jgi:threonine dehydrogenase-like Zn-dependent dehydrogenase
MENVVVVVGASGGFGVPQDTTIPNAQPTLYANITIGGGSAPVRAYMHDLLPDVLEGRIGLGLVFDRTTNTDGVPDGCRALNERESIKVTFWCPAAARLQPQRVDEG